MKTRKSIAAGALLLTAGVATAAPDPEQQCQKGRYATAAQYADCEQRALGRFAAGEHARFQQRVSSCRVEYTNAWARLQAKTSGTGASCEAARFVISDGTVVDNLTGLQWERKTDDGSVHDRDNAYRWGPGGTGAADGTVFTDFLATLNGSCFAGQCDWRLPTHAELQTILSEPYPCATSPCLDQGLFGPTLSDLYWSTTTDVNNAGHAWIVFFGDGIVHTIEKDLALKARAVRGGL